MGVRILPGSWLDHYMELRQDTAVPALFWTWTGLTLLASALRRRIVMDRGTYELYPNMYVIFVGPPGSKKSTAGKFGYNRLAKQVESIVCFSGRVTSEALLDKLSEVVVSLDAPDTLESDQSVFLFASELSTLFGGRINSRNTFSILDFLTAVYDTGEFDEGTRTNSFRHLNNICVNFLGATTPEGVSSLFNRVAIEGGFVSRTLFLYQDGIEVPQAWPDFSSMKQLKLQGLLADLKRVSRLQGQVCVTPEAKAWFTNWHDNTWHKASPPLELVQYWIRKPDHLLKISMLLSVAEGDSLKVGCDHMIKAEGLLKEAEIWIPLAFTSVDRPKQSWLREHILLYIRQQGGRIRRSQLTRKFDHRIGSVKELDEVLSPLIEGHVLGEDKYLSTRRTEYFITNKGY